MSNLNRFFWEQSRKRKTHTCNCQYWGGSAQCKQEYPSARSPSSSQTHNEQEFFASTAVMYVFLLISRLRGFFFAINEHLLSPFAITLQTTFSFADLSIFGFKQSRHCKYTLCPSHDYHCNATDLQNYIQKCLSRDHHGSATHQLSNVTFHAMSHSH